MRADPENLPAAPDSILAGDSPAIASQAAVTIVGRNRPPLRSPLTLLCAVAPALRQEFLPIDLARATSSANYIIQDLDPTGLSPESFRHELLVINPDVLLTAWGTPALPEFLPSRLRYVCHLCGSVRELVTRRHLEAGLTVTNWGGSISRTVAEGALFHILACLRRSTAWTMAMHFQGGWATPHARTDSLFERRVGIHGFGRVAQELVNLLRPFSPVVQVLAPDIDEQTARKHSVGLAASLDSLFSDNDVVVELAPLLPATRGIVGEALLRRLRPGAVFVNVGRGAVVDEDALAAVAAAGDIQVGLDVFATEPLPADSRLRGLANVSLTPHLAGPTNDRRRDAGAHALENLRAFASGRPLQAVVTPEKFDSST